MSSQLNKNLTGVGGEYLVAGTLSLKGYVASLTLKNYPSVDVFVMNPANDLTQQVQVKTSRGNSINLGIMKSHIDRLDEKIKGPFVFVKVEADNSCSFYIVPKTDLIKIIHDTDNEYYTKPRLKAIQEEYPMAIRFKHIEDYKDLWDNIWK